MEIIVGYLFGVVYFKCMLCVVHTAYIYTIKEENLPKLSVYRIWRKSLRTQERVRLIHGKRGIGVRATEVLLNKWIHPENVSHEGLSRQQRKEKSDWITKTYLYNFDPLQPHFYIVKLVFTGVYIIFLISAQNIDCGYSLKPPHWGNLCFEQKYENIPEFFIWEKNHCFVVKFSIHWIGVFS